MKKSKLFLAIATFAALSFQVLTYNAQAQICFSPTVNFAAGLQAHSAVSADFNGDSKIDLAITRENTILILLGNGLGSFIPADSFSAGNGAHSIIEADFNGDGNADLATANFYSSNVSVLLGNGAGGFTSANNFAVGGGPYSLISADFNEDGNADLAIATGSGSNNISVLLGDGAGGFDTSVIYTAGDSPRSITSADFNGDGHADLATANNLSNNVSVLLGNGSGGFGSAMSNSFNLGSLPVSIISADFNGDGKADLATANDGSYYLSVLLGDGTGNFASAANFNVGFHSCSVISADFNGDGKADLANANSSADMSILLGDGAGNFGTAIHFTVGSNPNSVLSGDFNGDGKTDLVTANNHSSVSVSLLLNSPPPNVTANASDSVVCPGKYLTLTGDGATFYSWSGGVVNGFAFAAPSATTTYTLTGTMGACSNTATKTVTVNPKPTSTFTLQNESFSGYCDGSIVAHLVGGTGTTQTQWFVGQTILTTDSIGGLCPGSYTLHLTDSQGCENDYVETILTGLIPPTPSICLVTVDSAHIHNLIVWEKTNLNMVPIDSFIIYREFGANNYHRIDAVSKNSLSFYDDLGANPASTGYRYKLKCKNALGVESLFSNYHNTIYLTNNDANFSWTQYQIENNNTPVSTYNIYRDDNSTGNFQNIGFTSGNQFGYTDLNFTSHPNASYYVEAVMSAGVCSPSRTSYSGSSSNVKHVGSNGIQKLNNTLAINIYPNPAANIFYIKGITGKTSILLYDVVGKLIIKKEVENNTSINTNQLTEGIYMLSSENQLGSTFYKIIICR